MSEHQRDLLEPADGSSPPEAPNGGEREAVPWSIAWFAGADLDVLDRVPRERTFYSALGTLVVVVACLTGFSTCLAVAYALQIEPADIWWVGAGATGVMLAVERLILQLPTTRNRWLPLALAWRFFFSLILAILVTEPLSLRLNEAKVDRQLAAEQRAAVHEADARIDAFFELRIKAIREERQDIRARVAELQGRATSYRERSIRATETGCGRVCRLFARRAGHFSEKLRAVSERNRRRLVELKRNLDHLRGRRSTEERTSKAAIDNSGDLLARVEALWAIMGKSNAAKFQVGFVAFLFLLLDLAPIIGKVFRPLTTDAPYDKHLAAAMRRDAVPALAEEAVTDLDEFRIEEQARAEREILRAEINFAADQRLAAIGGVAGGARQGGTPRVRTPSLREFTRRATPHEREFVAVPPELMRSGLVGTALLGALVILGTIWAAVANQTVTGMWLVVIAFVAAMALAIYSHGFRRAPAWALRAIFSVFLLGLILPLVVVGINLAR